MSNYINFDKLACCPHMDIDVSDNFRCKSCKKYVRITMWCPTCKARHRYFFQVYETVTQICCINSLDCRGSFFWKDTDFQTEISNIPFYNQNLTWGESNSEIRKRKKNMFS